MKPERFRLTKVCSLRLRQAEYEELSAFAAESGWSLSNWMRFWVLDGLTRERANRDASHYQAHKDDADEWGPPDFGTNSRTENRTRVRWGPLERA